MSRKAGRDDEAVPLTAGGTRSDVDLAAESGHNTNQGATPPPSDGIRSSEDLDEQQIGSSSYDTTQSPSTMKQLPPAAGKPEEIQDDSAACPVPFNSAIYEDDEGAKKRAATIVAAAASAPLSSNEGREDIIAHPTILEDDNAHPMPLHSMEDDDEGVKKRAATAAPLYAEEEEVEGLIEVEDDGYHPVPFNSANFEDDEQVKRRAAAAMAPLSSPAVINNGMTATVNEMYDEEEALGVDNDRDALEIDNGQEDADSLQQGNQQSSSNYEDSAMVDLDSSVALIPHAYLVEDDDDDNMVIAGYAEPIPPWWKQRRMRGMIAVIFLVLLIAAVAIGVVVSRRDSATVFLAITSSPTQSNVPSLTHSEAPTISFAPSLSPSSCSDTIVLNTKEVDTNLLVGGLKEPKVAIDGEDMVVAASDPSGYIYVVFYKKSIDGEWASNKYFVEECDDDGGCSYSVALSGGTALIGHHSDDDGWDWSESEEVTPVSVFEQDELGQWGRVEPLSKPSESRWRSFGYSVGIDGDLACVLGDKSGDIGFDPTLVIFRKVSEGWEQLYQESVYYGNGFEECEVSGDSIVAFGTGKRKINYYVFDRATGSIEPIQSDFGSGPDGYVMARSLDGSHLVLSGYNWDYSYSEHDYTVYIYKQYNKPVSLENRFSNCYPRKAYTTKPWRTQFFAFDILLSHREVLHDTNFIRLRCLSFGDNVDAYPSRGKWRRWQRYQVLQTTIEGRSISCGINLFERGKVSFRR